MRRHRPFLALLLAPLTLAACTPATPTTGSADPATLRAHLIDQLHKLTTAVDSTTITRLEFHLSDQTREHAHVAGSFVKDDHLLGRKIVNGKVDNHPAAWDKTRTSVIDVSRLAPSQTLEWGTRQCEKKGKPLAGVSIEVLPGGAVLDTATCADTSVGGVRVDGQDIASPSLDDAGPTVQRFKDLLVKAGAVGVTDLRLVRSSTHDYLEATYAFASPVTTFGSETCVPSLTWGKSVFISCRRDISQDSLPLDSVKPAAAAKILAAHPPRTTTTLWLSSTWTLLDPYLTFDLDGNPA